MTEAHTITILLLGDSNVGKSTFLSRLSQGPPFIRPETPISLLRDSDQPFVFEVHTRRQEYRIEIYDTASPENWRLLQPDVVIICYDISQRLSLINLQRVWIKEVRTTFPNSDILPVLVLGLKRDLRSEQDPNGIIYPQEAHRVASEMRADRYMECSALRGELLDTVFAEIRSTAIKTTTEEGGQSEGSCVAM